MSNEKYEIEIKCLLGERANAERLEARMKEIDPALEKSELHTQLNHYFEGKGDFKKAAEVLPGDEDRAEFFALAEKAKDFSLRSRDVDGTVYLVLKASIDDTTSANGTARREFEHQVPMTLDELDQVLLAAGFTYQAKWSRERTEYIFKGTTVTIDKNAGYGYLAEFETMVDDPSVADAAKEKLRNLIREVGLEELDQARLARMFAYYNANWRDYYGTEKVFTIK